MTDENETLENPEPASAFTAAVGSLDTSFIWKLLRDAERGLNRCGIYADVELGGVCYEVQKAQDRMKQGDFSKARKMLKDFNRENK